MSGDAKRGGRPRLLYARHGESTWNAVGRWQGQADPPLSERGRREAERLASDLGQESGVALLACSDLQRARETAARIGEALGLEPRALPELRELDAGAWSGLTRAEVAERWPEQLALFESGDLELRAGGGESRRALHVRVVAALRRLGAEVGRGTFVVVGHEGVLHTLAPGAHLATGSWLELDAQWLAPALPTA